MMIQQLRERYNQLIKDDVDHELIYCNMLKHFPEPLIVSDDKGRITHVSNAMKDLINVEDVHVILDKPVNDYINNDIWIQILNSDKDNMQFRENNGFGDVEIRVGASNGGASKLFVIIFRKIEG